MKHDRSSRPMVDLNASKIRAESVGGDGPDIALIDPGITSGHVTCHFRDIKRALIGYIRRFECVAGCVAWLTEPDILRALASRKGAAIIIQKEDFLRPDAGKNTRHDLRRLYDDLKWLDRNDFPSPLCGMSCCADSSLGGVRCVGNHNRSHSPAAPRAHHKFLVFGHLERIELPNGSDLDSFVAEAVWTGSYNLTVNAGRSLENGVFVTDPAVAAAYLHEFAQVAALSESLDWETDWMEPEWRIGT